MDSLQLLPLKCDLTQPAPTLAPVETIPPKAQREAALMASTVHRWHLEKELCWHATTLSPRSPPFPFNGQAEGGPQLTNWGAGTGAQTALGALAGQPGEITIPYRRSQSTPPFPNPAASREAGRDRRRSRAGQGPGPGWATGAASLSRRCAPRSRPRAQRRRSTARRVRGGRPLRDRSPGLHRGPSAPPGGKARWRSWPRPGRARWVKFADSSTTPTPRSQPLGGAPSAPPAVVGLIRKRALQTGCGDFAALDDDPALARGAPPSLLLLLLPRLHLPSGFRTSTRNPAPQPEGFSPARPPTPVCALGAPTLGRRGARRPQRLKLPSPGPGFWGQPWSRGWVSRVRSGGASVRARTVGEFSRRRVPASQLGELVRRKRQNQSRCVY
ncbi:progesterone receptor-like [Lutra lutra]|uniref:progesterone receptor-like n=1 Tax=Lutra lutra TaxID=9657 RepID=UPI001FD01444|nr:progesterone receptor-like [Lutra lutra]